MNVQDGNFHGLLSQVNKDGQEVHVSWHPNAGTKRLKFEHSDTFPARILEMPPAGTARFSNCDIVAQIYSRKVDPEASNAAKELSDLVTCNGES